MQTAPFFAAEALRKYDLPGPRYTSYPAAPDFGPHFDEAMLREYIRCSNAEPIPRELSLYVHVPYCFSPCFYCGCNRIITYDRSKGRKYVDRLIREIAMVGELFDRDRKVVQLHFGGGPSGEHAAHNVHARISAAVRN
jgi:oxygen-independent coproporphyrinogen-3 oxidase